ncbi:winged helix-turn-helix transcriptional regulator [Leptolyngbya sp. FACHB-321]|uniref:winged helix-turn-helix transcriptional regulator n=1 Tax=Leptolyngbya sp. FACHB-321 TaxID=2692807 RepID=UPI001F554E1F|nr:winged helix-turn-helix transcriptional regulator [Leptolyngbya sp. FACHB-321]
MTATQLEETVFVQTTIKIIGSKWKLLSLWHLKDVGKRFSKLKCLIPEITEKLLIQQLRALEKDEIVNRNVQSDVPPRVEYSFTAYGKALFLC